MYQTTTLLRNNKAVSRTKHKANVAITQGQSEQESQKDSWIFFNPELAELLGGMDGIAGAILCWKLDKWIKCQRKRVLSKEFAYWPQADSEKYLAYRSLRELEGDLGGLWGHSSIDAILKRVEKASVGLTVHRSKEQLHFGMSEALAGFYSKKKGYLGCKLSDAIKHGILPGLFIANLSYQIDEFPRAITDDAGNKYGTLSPKRLTERLDENKKPSPTGKRIFPVSEDAAKAAIKSLREAGGVIPHPDTRLKSTYRLPVNGSRQVAKLDRQVAKLDSSFSEMECNPMQMCDLHNFSETLIDNITGKCITTEAIGVNPSASSHSFNLSTGGQILMDACKEAALRQDNKTPVAFSDNAIYSVQDYDKVAFSGVDLFYGYIPVCPITAQLYADKYVDDAKDIFDSYGMEYKKADLEQLRQLFINYPSFTDEHVSELLGYGIDFATGELFAKPEKGHDRERFRRIVKTGKQFLRYLPQLARELYQHDNPGLEMDIERSTGKTSFNYTEMKQPYLSLAFADDRTPIFHDIITTVEPVPVTAVYLTGGEWVKIDTGRTEDVEHDRYRPVYYSEWTNGERAYYFIATYDAASPKFEQMKALPLVQEPKAVQPIELSSDPKARQRELDRLKEGHSIHTFNRLGWLPLGTEIRRLY